MTCPAQILTLAIDSRAQALGTVRAALARHAAS